VDDSPLLGWGTSWWRDPTYRSSIYGSGVVSQPSYVVAVQSHHARYYLVKSIWW
jgi:hypothetical protein